ncbi:sensor domain-containing protein [Sulfurimonas sp.]
MLEDETTKAALDQIYMHTKASVIAIYVTFLFVVYIVKDFISFEGLVTLFALHSFVFTYRFNMILQYKKSLQNSIDVKFIRKWKRLFGLGSLLSGLAWGSVLFFVDATPMEYKLLIIVIIIGLAGIAMSTLGALLSIYLLFVLPMLSLVMLWLVLQTDNNIYTSAIFLLIIVASYYFISVKRFALNYRNSFIEESNANTLKQRIELALEGSNTSILDWDIRNNNFFISESWKVLLGYSGVQLRNSVETWQKRVHKDDIKQLLVSLRRHFKNKAEVFENIHRLQHKDGHYVWILGRAQIFYDENGNAIRMVGTHTDVTNAKKIEADLAEKNKILEASQRLAHIGSWKFDLRKNKLTWSDEIYRIFEIDKTYIPSYEMFIEAVHPDDRDMVKSAYTNSLKGQTSYDIIHRLFLKNGTIKYVKEECETSFSVDGRPLISIGTIQDITKQKDLENLLHKQKEILEHQAHHDTLTELPNRILLLDRLNQLIQKATRDKSEFAVLFLDLDHFKEINDSLGHDVGDVVLQEVTKRFQAIIRKEDTLARLGGDEFTIIMGSLQLGENASILALKVLASLTKPVVVQNNTLYLSCSIGISLYPTDGKSAQDLLKYADAAMYKAKDEGRNNFQFYSAEMTQLALDRVTMLTNLRSALDKDEFVVYYQPQIDATCDKIIGMEALVRWVHPTQGLISPDKFIPLAESTGLIVNLDRIVMQKAISQLVTWYSMGLEAGTLALNLSIKQLQQKDFIHHLQKLLKETGCQPEWLEFELTEGQIMTNPQEAITILSQISDLGIGLSVDDFGTGYSSLSYLKKLPIDKLKIDQSFIQDLPDDEEDAAITKAVIALAKSLNLKIIAEGVETKEQKNFIVEHGCHNIQGYYYSRPISKEDMEIILRRGTIF